MCGIAGFIQGRNSKVEINCNTVANEMADALKHRGPDDKGVWIDDEIYNEPQCIRIWAKLESISF